MKALHAIAFILVVVGGLNWGLVGVGAGDVVMLLGATLAKIVYVLVGLSALWLIVTHKGSCKYCTKGESSAPQM
ncbi:MAG: DUF378 domain-containing protein [Patescibacteria group bacterium]|nr:DUF378 domain-containing protein [Patescibacteria group bacterium]